MTTIREAAMVARKTSAPSTSILSPSFVWVPPAAVDVAATWRRFGWKPVSEREEEAKPQPNVTQLRKASK